MSVHVSPISANSWPYLSVWFACPIRRYCASTDICNSSGSERNVYTYAILLRCFFGPFLYSWRISTDILAANLYTAGVIMNITGWFTFLVCGRFFTASVILGNYLLMITHISCSKQGWWVFKGNTHLGRLIYRKRLYNKPYCWRINKASCLIILAVLSFC